MNSVTAVLLALVLIVVILVIVWLVLRSRSSDPPQGATASGSGTEGEGVPEGVPAGAAVGDWVAPAHSPDAPADAPADEPSPSPAPALSQPALEEPARDRMSDEGGASAAGVAAAQALDVAAASAEEFVDPGLSELAVEAAADHGDGAISGTPPRTPPRTPTEAFGSAHDSGEVATRGTGGRETSVLDDPDSDSTPLFRSIREELMGSAAAEDPEQSAEAEAVEAQENARSETVTEGVVETGAVGSGSVDPAAEEEQLLESDEETVVDVVNPESGGATDENQPVPRISALHEVVDGGFGIGSAATIADGAQPLGHPIKANVDTKTYQDLRSPWYDETEPDVWFLDPGFAERAGFRRAD